MYVVCLRVLTRVVVMQMGNTVAVDRASNESRMRRLRLACARWKTDYQRELHTKYTEMVGNMEGKYMAELQALCEQLRLSNAALHQAQAAVQQREKDLLEREVVSEPVHTVLFPDHG